MKIIPKKSIQVWYKREYSDMNESVYGEPVKQLKEFFNILASNGNNKKILELGCGDGRNLLPLAKLGYNVTGVDQHGKKATEVMAKNLGLKVNFIEKDLTKFKFENEKYYAIISSEVFHLMNRKDISITIEKMKLATMKNGHIYISILTNLKRYFIESKEEFKYEDQSDYNIEEAEKLLKSKFNDWKIIKLDVFHDEQDWPLRKRDYPIKPYHWSGDYVYIVAKKII